MHTRALTLLLLLVAGLGALFYLRQKQSQDLSTVLADRALFDGLEPSRVLAMRVDNVLRSYQVKLERDSEQRWYLTEPVAFPADQALVEQLLASARSCRGQPVGETDLQKLGLSPPRAVLELTEAIGSERVVLRVELGAADVDGQRCYVRAVRKSGEALVLRAPRLFDPVVERNPDEYREQRLFPFDASELVGFERSGGRAGRGGDASDQGFRAEYSETGWRVRQPFEAPLDPQAFGTYAFGLCRLRISRFHDDAALEPGRYGLDQPLIELGFEFARGQRVRARFAPLLSLGLLERPEDELWLCQIDDQPFVFEIDGTDVLFASMSLPLLLDHALLRAPRALVRAVSIEGSGGKFELRRLEDPSRPGEWEAARLEPSSAVEPERFAAERGRVEDLLALLERQELAAWAPELPFQAAEPRSAWSVELVDGTRLGGELGTEHGQAGARAWLYRPQGESCCALVGAQVAGLCSGRVEDFLSLLVWRVSELELAQIRVASADQERVWLRDQNSGLWRPSGLELEAGADFLELLEPLLAPRALRWVGQGEELAQAALEQVLEVELRPRVGPALRVRLGRFGELAVSEFEGRRAEVSPRLHTGLEALLVP